MARASWKYHLYKESDIRDYLLNLTLDEEDRRFHNFSLLRRNTTVTSLNCFKRPNIYTGKWLFDKYLTKYHIGFKLGQFSKTRKPFFFRSKKKK